MRRGTPWHHEANRTAAARSSNGHRRHRMTDTTDHPSAEPSDAAQRDAEHASLPLHAPDEIRITLYKRPPFLLPRAAPCCDLCGFTVAGLPTPGICPECGTPYNERSSHRLLETPSIKTMAVYLARPLLVPAFCVGVLLVHDFHPLRVLDTLIWWIAMLGLCLFTTQFSVRSSSFAFLLTDQVLPRRHPLRASIRRCGYLAGTLFVISALATIVCAMIGFLGALALLAWVLP